MSQEQKKGVRPVRMLLLLSQVGHSNTSFRVQAAVEVPEKLADDVDLAIFARKAADSHPQAMPDAAVIVSGTIFDFRIQR